MAIEHTVIKKVRVFDKDGVPKTHIWDPARWYLVRDDQPFLDILTQGRPANFKVRKMKFGMEESEAGMQWQRWDLSEELSRNRRFGEVSAELNVPKNCTLRCYVIPTALLTYRDVVTMVQDVESELGISVAWDERPDRMEAGRSWGHLLNKTRSMLPLETLDHIEAEIVAAHSVRRDPFEELGPTSRSGTPLPENSLVTQWAIRRASQLRDISAILEAETGIRKAQLSLNNPEGRKEKIDLAITRLDDLLRRTTELCYRLPPYVNNLEVGAPINLNPIFQRDHRLRLLLRAFAPSPVEAISESLSTRSTYPPVMLNHLWELWGIVWIAKQLRNLGFSGACFVETIKSEKRCSWHFEKDGVTIKLDFEPEPALVDYTQMPPVHERAIPAFEWAASNQNVDRDRPFLGMEEKCSPDYLIRILSSTDSTLLVGDAALATPEHHKKNINQIKTKPQIVERYRRTIGWVADDKIVRCHPMGAFVVFPPPSSEWSDLETIEQARDCTILCPSPLDDREASNRLTILLNSLVPELGSRDNTV